MKKIFIENTQPSSTTAQASLNTLNNDATNDSGNEQKQPTNRLGHAAIRNPNRTGARAVKPVFQRVLHTISGSTV